MQKFTLNEIIVKTAPVLIAFALFNFWSALLFSITQSVLRRVLIGLFFGLKPMMGLDTATFQSIPQSPCNCITISYLKTQPSEL